MSGRRLISGNFLTCCGTLLPEVLSSESESSSSSSSSLGEFCSVFGAEWPEMVNFRDEPAVSKFVDQFDWSTRGTLAAFACQGEGATSEYG